MEGKEGGVSFIFSTEIHKIFIFVSLGSTETFGSEYKGSNEVALEKGEGRIVAKNLLHSPLEILMIIIRFAYTSNKISKVL